MVLWKTLEGEAPSNGSYAELMDRRQQVPLALETLKDVPQPVTALLEVLLEKDPARRFQNPAELLGAIPKITSAIDAGLTITRQSLYNGYSRDSFTMIRRPTARP